MRQLSRALASLVVIFGAACSEPAPCEGGRCAGDGGPSVDAGVDAGADAGVARDASTADAASADAGDEPPLVRSTDFAEASGDVRNPDRGLYWWDWNDDASLVLVKVQLGEHCDAATLPASVLDAARARLGGHRDAAGARSSASSTPTTETSTAAAAPTPRASSSSRATWRSSRRSSPSTRT